jgi:hypothetical protein
LQSRHRKNSKSNYQEHYMTYQIINETAASPTVTRAILKQASIQLCSGAIGVLVCVCVVYVCTCARFCARVCARVYACVCMCARVKISSFFLSSSLFFLFIFLFFLSILCPSTPTTNKENKQPVRSEGRARHFFPFPFFTLFLTPLQTVLTLRQAKTMVTLCLCKC